MKRLSNIELLRCIAMFFIIAVHADYWLLGEPTNIEAVDYPVPSFTRIFFEQICVVGVDIFILISGWFGIKPSKKSFLSFVFQILFFKIIVAAVGIGLGLVPLSLKVICSLFLFGKGDWFIKAYIALYILAPILNIYIENINKRSFAITLTSLFAILLFYGWTNSALWIMQGYSVFTFICLYLLARFIRIYKENSLKGNYGIIIYIMTVLISSVIGFIGCYIPVLKFTTNLMISYVNPFVLCGSLGLLIFFIKLKINYSPIINRIGKSTFAVYLFPSYFIFDYIYKNIILNFYESYQGIIALLLIFCTLTVVYFISILIDQLRILLWNKLQKLLYNINIL